MARSPAVELLVRIIIGRLNGEVRKASMYIGEALGQSISHSDVI